MIAQADLPEWMALARMAQTIDLSPVAKEKLAAYAAVAPDRRATRGSASERFHPVTGLAGLSSRAWPIYC